MTVFKLEMGTDDINNKNADKHNKPEISTILLNWNRLHLLKKTIYSYLDTISVPFELIIIDNGSTDGSQDFINNVCKENSNLDSILLPKNEGGKVLNLGLERAKSKLLHVSENDLIYKTGWDKIVLKAFNTFPKLGQLSLYSPFFSKELEGGSSIEYMQEMRRKEKTIYISKKNVHTSSVFRREIWDKGVRWQNVGTGYMFPDDSSFSYAVKRLGYFVAWNDEFLATPQGFKIEEYYENLYYYIESCKSKPWLKIQGLKDRLQKAGYRLVETDSTESGYTIVRIEK